MIDRWTLVHFAFWFVVGANFTWHGVPLLFAALATLAGAVVWELVEMTLEKYNIVSGRETWLNRWVSDILVAFLGAAAGMWWVW